MEQLQALKEPAKKVEAGTWDMSGFMKAYDLDIINATFSGHVTDLINITEHDSLDAAHSLHKAVLGDISQFSIVTDPTCLKVTVCFWPNGLSEGTQYYAEGWSEANPARAWLLAIIKAKITELETKNATA